MIILPATHIDAALTRVRQLGGDVGGYDSSSRTTRVTLSAAGDGV
jgi:hypothetical protein